MSQINHTPERTAERQGPLSSGRQDFSAPNSGIDAYLPITAESRHLHGEKVYTGGADRIYLVTMGRVLVQRHRCGRAWNVGMYGVGDLFGEWALNGILDGTEAAIAHGACGVMSWPLDRIEELLATKPGMWAAFANILLTRNSRALGRIADFWLPNEQRLAAVLLRMTRDHGSNLGAGKWLLPAMTHELLAADVFSTREIVTGSMSKLRKAGAIQYSRRAIIVHLNLLSAVAAGKSQKKAA